MPIAYKSTQQTDLDAIPRKNLKPNELGGRIRIAFWTFTTGSVTAPDVNDTIDLVTLPKGARILGGQTVNEAMSSAGGTAGVSIGIAGAAAKYASALDLDAAGSDLFANTIALNYGEVLAAETKIIATVTGEAWATSKKFYGHILYAVD